MLSILNFSAPSSKKMKLASETKP